MLVWFHHLVNLLFEAASLVPTSLGSTWIGLFFPLWVFIITEIVFGFVNGWKTWKVWASNVKVGVVTTLIAWGILFSCCLVGAVYRDHKYFVEIAASFRQKYNSAVQDRETAVAVVRSDLGSKLITLQRGCNKTEGMEETLSQQNRDQQNSINQCTDKTIALITPTALKTHHFLIDKDRSTGKVLVDRYVITSNKPISPMVLTATCDKTFTAFGAYLLLDGMSGSMEESDSVNTGRAMTINVTSPPLSPDQPFELRIDHLEPNIRCAFSL